MRLRRPVTLLALLVVAALAMSLVWLRTPDAAEALQLGAVDLLLLTLRAAMRSLLAGVAAAALVVLLGAVIGFAAGLVRPGTSGPPRAMPALLAALLIAGVARCLMPPHEFAHADFAVLVVAIALARAPSVARGIRRVMRRQRGRPHLDAARLLGLPEWQIVLRHVLPAVAVQSATTLRFGILLAVQDETALSFLGVGLSAAHPSLGTLLSLGVQQATASGAWPVLLLPASILAVALVAARLWLDRGVARTSA